MADDIFTTQNEEINGAMSDNDIWPTLYDPQINLEELSVECDSAEKLAEAVLDEYNIEYSDESGAGTGGELKDMDIMRMDAMTVVNWSLIERAGKSGRGFIEPIMSSDGVVEFRSIGNYSAEISDIYYEISTGSFSESPRAVMVTGGKQLPEVRPMRWYPVWGTDPVKIYNQRDMLQNCRKDDYIRYASIVFEDPQTTSTYNDGIENLYEITDDNAWERIAGYVNFIDPGTRATPDTKIEYHSNATIFQKIGEGDASGPDMGTLVRRPTFPDADPLEDQLCLSPEAGVESSPDMGVEVLIDEALRYDLIRGVRKDSFSSISGVYLIGKKISALTIQPLDGTAQTQTPTIDNCKSRFSITKPETTTMKLDEGKHYVVAYDGLGDDPKPYIVFINNTHEDDPFAYGKGHTMYVNPFCAWARQSSPPKGPDEEVTKTVYPNDLFQGIMVDEIWVAIDLTIPSISVYDPDGTGERALDVAQDLKYYISPIIINEPPAPVAYADAGGATLVNQLPRTDTDPTTAQDFKDTEMEQHMDEMQGGGMTISYSFLNEDEVEGMASMLYDHFRSDVVETVYTCGPDCNPILGGYGDRGGVVNSIRYNYTDSGSYTVSVTEGPKLVGNLTPVDGGPSMKMAENFGGGGKIIDQVGDNIHFKIRIDGYGDRWAINMSPSFLRIGDIVTCTVHNNPVEA